MNWLKALWTDESGAVVSAEAAVVGAVGILGATAGIDAVSESLTAELQELSGALRGLDQSYSVGACSGPGAWRAASEYQQPVEVSCDRNAARPHETDNDIVGHRPSDFQPSQVIDELSELP